MHSVSLCTQIACILEATARKPGNVHRFQDFEDATYLDYLLSAAAISPLLDNVGRRGVGRTILEGIQRTRQVTKTNTNLGILLLLSPLAAVPDGDPLEAGVMRVLEQLTVDDAKAVYEAIRLAQPGGLGEAAEQDVREEPTQTLREVMTLAANRDLVARQYANGFREVFQTGVPALLKSLPRAGSVTPLLSSSSFDVIETAIISCHLHLMAAYPDTLIARKRGPVEAQESARLAAHVLAAGWPQTSESQAALKDLDDWLRAVGHARNPGTTADLVTASLFVALRGRHPTGYVIADR